MSVVLLVVPVLGTVLLFLKDPISRWVYRVREASDAVSSGSRVGVTVIWVAWKAVSVAFYVFLFVFPLLALFVYFAPQMTLAKENGFTLQYLLLYDQRDDAIDLLRVPVDKSLPDETGDVVQQDAAKLKALFENENEWNVVVSWSHSVAHDDSNYNIPFERKLSDDEAAHLAWRWLLRVPGAKEADLSNLEAAIAKAIPDQASRARLFDWGQKRLAYFDEAKPRPYSSVSFPKLDWFAWYLVYSDYCPSDAGFAARQAFIVERLGREHLGHEVWPALLAWGEDLLEERERESETLLPEGDRANLVAVLDHISGYTPTGQTIEQLRDDYQIGFGRDIGLQTMFLHIFYPNDDMTYLMFGEGWNSDHSFLGALGESFGADPSALTIIALNLIFWALLVQRCMRRLSIHYFGKLLGLADDPKFTSYRDGVFSPWIQGLGLVVVIPLSWLLARLFLDDMFVPYFRSELHLVFAVLYTALIGGALCEAFDNIVAVVFIRSGFDPESMFVDNIVAGVVGAGVLWYFQNSWFSILSGIALGLFTSLSVKVASRSGNRSPNPETPRRRRRK